MSVPPRPVARPANPRFSPGPTAKRPGWRLDALADAPLGRNHRSPPAREKLRAAIAAAKRVLKVPDDYEIVITPGSDTGAVECAMWNLLGRRGVDVFAWEAFSDAWAQDAADQLALPDLRIHDAAFGDLPDLAAARPDRDIVFAWNGTTSGVRVPDADWIAADRTGVVICDATSAAFAQDLDWAKLDATTFSWQKALGGEAGVGMLVLSPRAVAQLEAWRPARPIPKVFRLLKGGRVDRALFDGSVINTLSLLSTEDFLDAIAWAERVGGLDGLRARADANAAGVYAWLDASAWAAPLCANPAWRSNTSVCMRFRDPTLSDAERARRVQDAITTRLADEGVAFDIAAYRAAPPGLRLWTGPTVETTDLAQVLSWLDWAYAIAAEEANAGVG